MYKLFTTHDNKQIVIKLDENESFIPFDPANTDYQQYLQWIAEGNAPIGADTPEPAEEQQ